MQISIEQHATVISGLGTELGIHRDLLVESQAALGQAQEDFNEVEANFRSVSSQLTDQALGYERMLERIRQVATGEFPPCTRAGEPEWSVALAEVEVLL